MVVVAVVAALVIVAGSIKAIADSAANRLVETQAVAALGDSFASLPPADRIVLARRVDAAIRANPARLSSPIFAGSTAAATDAGGDRLDDDVVLERLALQSSALIHVNVASCAAVARWIWLDHNSQAAAVRPIAIAAFEAWNVALEALPDAERLRYFEIKVMSLEAEMRESPQAHRYDFTTQQTAWRNLLLSLDGTLRGSVDALVFARPVDDRIACEIVRHYYATGGISNVERVATARYLGAP